jgi:chorismate mutase
MAKPRSTFGARLCKMAQLYPIYLERSLMPTRAIRGATTATENSDTAILGAASELLRAILVANGLAPEHLISILFTLTSDLDAAYPTRAAREMGWTDIPLLDAQQPRVQGDLPRCVRVLVHCDTELAKRDIKHVYLGEAKRLRPDLAG